MSYPFNFGKHTLTDVLNHIRYATDNDVTEENINFHADANVT